MISDELRKMQEEQRSIPLCAGCSRARQIERNIEVPLPDEGDSTGGSWVVTQILEREWICAETGVAASRRLYDLGAVPYEIVVGIYAQRGEELVRECDMFRKPRPSKGARRKKEAD